MNAVLNKHIVIVTNASDQARLKVLRDAHIDPGATYHPMTAYQVEDKVKGLTVIGVILDQREFDSIPEAGRTALKTAAMTYLQIRGLKKVEDLLTYVRN